MLYICVHTKVSEYGCVFQLCQSVPVHLGFHPGHGHLLLCHQVHYSAAFFLSFFFFFFFFFFFKMFIGPETNMVSVRVGAPISLPYNHIIF